MTDNSTPEHKPPAHRRPGKPFPKGKSGNPGGRPKDLVAVVEAARAHTADAVQTLADIMGDASKPAAARVAAAQAILDRGWGKATQPVEVPGEHRPFVIYSVPMCATAEEWEAKYKGGDGE